MEKIKDEWAYLGHKSDFKCNLVITVGSFICFIGIGICMGIVAVGGDERWIIFGFPWAFVGSCAVGFLCATLEHLKWMRILGGKG